MGDTTTNQQTAITLQNGWKRYCTFQYCSPIVISAVAIVISFCLGVLVTTMKRTEGQFLIRHFDRCSHGLENVQCETLDSMLTVDSQNELGQFNEKHILNDDQKLGALYQEMLLHRFFKESSCFIAQTPWPVIAKQYMDFHKHLSVAFPQIYGRNEGCVEQGLEEGSTIYKLRELKFFYGGVAKDTRMMMLKRTTMCRD